ncbi:hypothetical protein KGY71_01335 [Candidatus Bipolaricaulota bacterium]|nr:hypothetical protein [Candidatus Bipolaricaulota bacterium]
MHSIKELADILGYSVYQLRDRLDQLRPWFDQYIQRGEKNKILIDGSGLEVLRRFKDMEDRGVSLKEIPEKIQTELNKDKVKQKDGSSGKNTQVSQNTNQTDLDRDQNTEKGKRIEELQEQVEYLRKQIEKKDKIIQEKDEQLHRYLPEPEEEKKKEDEFKELGLLQVIKKWFKTKT